MARSTAQVFGHLPGLFQQLLRVAYHLWISAQHHMAGFFIHWQPYRLFQFTAFNQRRYTPGQLIYGCLTANNRLDA